MPDNDARAYDGGVNDKTINVHYHPKDDVHWKLDLSPSGEWSLSETEDNELHLEANNEHQVFVANVDEGKAHEFTVKLEFQSDQPAATTRLHSRGLTGLIENNTLTYQFSLDKKSGEPPPSREFTYLPLESDEVSISATGDDPRFKIKLKT